MRLHTSALLNVIGTEQHARLAISTFEKAQEYAREYCAFAQGATIKEKLAFLRNHFAQFGLYPADKATTKSWRNRNYSGLTDEQRNTVRFVAAIETRMQREEAKERKTASAPAADASAPAADASAPAADASNKLENGKGKTALKELKGLASVKSELAEIFASMQQALVNEELDKLADLILQGQKVLAIGK